MHLQHSGSIPFSGLSLRELTLGETFRIVERSYAPHTRFPIHAHDRAFIGVTLSGAYAQTHRGVQQEFRPGDVCFTPIAEPHESQYSETGARVLHLEIPRQILRRLASAGLGVDTYMVLRGGTSYVAAQQLYEEFQSPDSLSPWILDGLGMRLLGHIFRQQSTAPKNAPRWLHQAERYISENYAESLSLEEIARTVQVHPVHLAREYRRHYQRTVGERVRELRFEVASKELLGTSRSLAEIALLSGYSDQSHFSVAFKKHTGMAPSEYRRHHLSANFAQLR